MYPNGYPTGIPEMAYQKSKFLKTETSVSIQVVIFKKNGKSNQDLDGIEVACCLFIHSFKLLRDQNHKNHDQSIRSTAPISRTTLSMKGILSRRQVYKQSSLGSFS